ncbi:MAG TPA: hypothetical protein DIU39_02830 [Flavobacteriales bacterium]|nr:hypothetical protein [Flavobacteriales bacterium]
MKLQKAAYWVLLFLVLITGISGYFASKQRFNYDFESFFPKENETLDFFLTFRDNFENDNDYILFAFEPEKSVFDTAFLQKVDAFARELKENPLITDVVSPTQIKLPVVTSFGVLNSPLLHLNSPEKLAKDSLKIARSEHWKGSLFASDLSSVCVLAKNVQVIKKRESDSLMTAVEQLLNKYDFHHVYWTGKVRAQQVYMRKMKTELLTFFSISVVLVIIILFITYRSVWGVVVPLMSVFLPIVITVGVMQIFNQPLDLLTSLLPTILFVVGTSDAIHLTNKYLSELRHGIAKETAIRNTFKEIGFATFLTSFTTAVGFLTLMFSNIEPVQNFGLYAAVGVLVAYVVTILFLPAVFILMHPPKIIDFKKTDKSWKTILHKLFEFILSNRKKIVFTTVVLTLVSLWGIGQIKINYYLLQDLSEEHPLKKDLRYFEHKYSGVRPFEMVVMLNHNADISLADLQLIDSLEHYLRNEYKVGFIVSPVYVVKMLNQAQHGGNSRYFSLPKTQKEWERLQKKFSAVFKKEEWQLVYNKDKKWMRISGKMPDVGSYYAKIKNDKLQQFADELFQTQNDKYQVKITGTALLIDINNNYLAENLITGLLIAFVVISLIIGLLFKSGKMIFIALVPNILPLLFIAGIMGFAHVDMNMSTSIVFTIAFGIAVDDTIHFLSKYKLESTKQHSKKVAVLNTFLSTGKAIILTTVVLFFGFAALMFSDFTSTYYIGFFVSLILFFAVICDLFLLPLLLLPGKKK